MLLHREKWQAQSRNVCLVKGLQLEMLVTEAVESDRLDGLTFQGFVHHLGNAPTAAEGALVEEVAGLIVWCRSARLALLQGQKFDVAPYCTAVNSLRRLLCDLGLEARAFDVTDAWDGYLARKSAEKDPRGAAGRAR